MHRTRFEVAVQRQTHRRQLLIRPRHRGFEVHIAIGLHRFGRGLQCGLKQRAIKRGVNENQIHTRRAELLQTRHPIGAQHVHVGGLEAVHLGAELRHQGGVKFAHLHMGRTA